MARIVTNLPAEFENVAAAAGPEDELLTADELAVLSIFESLKKAPSFEKFPGSTLLRKCRRGRVLVEQGDAGATAFTILTTATPNSDNASASTPQRSINSDRRRKHSNGRRITTTRHFENGRPLTCWSIWKGKRRADRYGSGSLAC